MGQQLRMPSFAKVTIHSSQLPDAVRRGLLESLRTRRINHKFHYDSAKQTTKWIALHQAFAPSRNDDDCARIYDAAFIAAAERIDAGAVHLVGLGCGGGRKDTRLLSLLKEKGKRVAYTPSDVSTAMVLVASETARGMVLEDDCHPLVCDLEMAEDLPEVLGNWIEADEARVVTFFGMIPNFEPGMILPRLASLLRREDWLLFSANLAPGANYEDGIRRVLPQYDNELTRDWLMTFLLDMGVERADGELRFVIEPDPAGSALKRIAAYFRFERARRVRVDGVEFEFRVGEAVRMFFSYRYTPGLVRELLGGQGIGVVEQWVTKSGEEGVFLCRRG